MDHSPATASGDPPPGRSPDDLPPELRGRRLELRDNLRNARELASSVGPAGYRWRPAAEAWSVGQCLQHLVRSNRSYLDALRPVLERAGEEGTRASGPFRYGIPSRWFVRAMEPPPRRRFRAPERFAPAAEPPAAERVLADLAATHSGLEGALRRASGLDLARVRVRSPASRLLRLPLGQVFALLAAHERRHLWQARQLLAAPGFPGRIEDADPAA